MVGSEIFNWFSTLIVPLVLLGAGVLILQMVWRRCWHRVLPIFSRYAVFYCLSGVLLLTVLYSSWYPGRLQNTLCLIYLDAYKILLPVNFLFFLAVVYELVTYTVRTRPEIRTRWIRRFAITGVVFALAIGVAAFASVRTSGCCAFEKFADAATNAGTLVISAMLLVLFLLKKRFGLYWGRSISLIVSGAAFLYAMEIAALIVGRNQAHRVPSEVLNWIGSFIWLTFWFVAVSKSPDTGAPAAAPS